ncbi:MAG: hypothetical protein IT447_02815 [Phycisphaerales bacterium]|jgi:hypothetical protein|nr:hypothetical protein [Phycisphaerales bacterium]
MNATTSPDAADLMAVLDALGIQLKADRDRLRFHPQDKVTPELAGRMKLLKPELLAILAKHDELNQRIADQLAALIPYRTPTGRRGLVNPKYRNELDRLGLL